MSKERISRVRDTWSSAVLAIAVAIIAAVPPTLMAWAALQESAETKFKVTDTHNLVNSRMTEMLKEVNAAATAKATLAEQAAEKARQSAAAEAKLHRLPNRIAKENTK